MRINIQCNYIILSAQRRCEEIFIPINLAPQSTGANLAPQRKCEGNIQVRRSYIYIYIRPLLLTQAVSVSIQYIVDNKQIIL